MISVVLRKPGTKRGNAARASFRDAEDPPFRPLRVRFDVMITSIVKALTTSGVQTSGVNAPTGAGEAGVRELLLKAEAERFVLFLVREWKADTYLNTALIYDVTLSVLQGDGSQLAEKSLQGRDNLGSSLVPADARVNTEKAFRRKLEEAINDPAVAAALQ